MTRDPHRTPHIHLRAVQDSDLDALFNHQAEPESAAMAAVPARARHEFDAHWAKIRLDQTTTLRTILADGHVAGTITSWPDHHQQLIGYRIGREYWGRGIATRALTLFLDELPDRPLYAHVAAHNSASIHVLQKCGFQREHLAETPPPDDGIEEFLFVRRG